MAELRRRRVFRVAVVYAIVAFGILQVADIAFPALRLPEWSITLVVALTLLGFPIAMVLAWAFDITPRGVVRTEPLAGTPTYAGPSRTLALTAVAAVLVVTLAAGLYILPKLPGWWGEGGTVAASGGSRKMLVVLPFVNLGSPVDQYFADGITEEITARLASITGLGVIARTSALRYKETDKTVQEIGQELGVAYILEGTVRWENLPEGQSRVRVTPQLIRVTDATHVWAEIYEEPLASVFEVQSEIAEKVADALDVTLRRNRPGTWKPIATTCAVTSTCNRAAPRRVPRKRWRCSRRRSSWIRISRRLAGSSRKCMPTCTGRASGCCSV
ncbi:MAG: hypothetical protein AMS25_14025 [Gemmatimonas sp. SM23_52]|nr:MAG: hypothetical protein AMS25_14025 [Gemmatimonas sp. SM23_52]